MARFQRDTNTGMHENADTNESIYAKVHERAPAHQHHLSKIHPFILQQSTTQPNNQNGYCI